MGYKERRVKDMEALKEIKYNPLFRGIDETNLKTILNSFSLKNYQKDEVLYKEGERIDVIFIVLSGEIKITTSNLDGSERIINTVKKNELVAEAFAISPHAVSIFNFTALSDTTVLMIPTEDFMLLNNRKIMTNMLYILANDNVQSTQQLESVAKTTIKERIYEVLKYFYYKQQKETVQLPYNKTQLSKYLSVNRSSLTREIRKMEEEGYFTNKKNEYTLNLKYFQNV